MEKNVPTQKFLKYCLISYSFHVGFTFSFSPLEFSTCQVPLWKISIEKCCLSNQCHDNYPVQFVVVVQEVSHFTPFALSWQIIGMSIQQYSGVGWAELTNSWPHWLCLKRHHCLLRFRYGVGKHSQENLYLTSLLTSLRNFIYGGWKCLYIY